MQKCLFYLLLSILFSCEKTPKMKSTLPAGAIPVADVSLSQIKILLDTVEYKNKIRTLIDVSKDIKFDKLEVMKQETLGDIQSEFYYLLATDKKNHLTIAKWLEKIDGQLYIIESGYIKKSIEEPYLICVGDGDCRPQVYVEGSEKKWSCYSNDKGCSFIRDTDCKMFQATLY